MLSMKAKYALRALMVLANTKDPMLSSRAISEAADVPQKFLDTILQELRSAGFIDAKRGIFGGYFLAHPAKNIVLGDVMRIIDGPLAPIRCASLTAYQKCDDCEDEESCRIRKLMLEVRNAVANVLDNRTLATLSNTEAVQILT